jgi:hypothetical protein
MARKKSKFGQYSGFSRHKLHKGKLLGKMHDLPISLVEWDRDLIPEHLWIELLANLYPGSTWLSLYNSLLDELDKICPSEITLLGYISDFGTIPEDRRKGFLQNNDQLVYESFYKPFGRIVAFYPEAPCYWMLQEKYLTVEVPLDPDIELRKLSDCILRLWPGKDEHAGHIRAVPLNRIFKHNKIRLPHNFKVIPLLKKYPTECTKEEQHLVQQFARSTLSIIVGQTDHYKLRAWPKYFWRHNFDISPCIRHPFGFKPDLTLDENNTEILYQRLKDNAETAVGYLDDASNKYKFDIYNPERDEIILGLFSRLTRLYVLLCVSPTFWARDIAGIILRCLTDTAITFAYLTKAGTEKELKNFKSYGEGKEKLLMLHLQDTFPGEKSVEGRTVEDIANDLGGGFMPELIDIELGNWTQKSARNLATIAGMDEFYKLVYDPTSSDVHGTWISVKNTNLTRCRQPLHRFHRIPHHHEPPLFISTINTAQRIFLKCIEVGVSELGFPNLIKNLYDIEPFLKQNESEK